VTLDPLPEAGLLLGLRLRTKGAPNAFARPRFELPGLRGPVADERERLGIGDDAADPAGGLAGGGVCGAGARAGPARARVDWRWPVRRRRYDAIAGAIPVAGRRRLGPVGRRRAASHTVVLRRPGLLQRVSHRGRKADHDCRPRGEVLARILQPGRAARS